jgi:hypothetical protein
MILAILAIWFGYKKAKASGRNPYLWAFICAIVFIGTQLLTAILIGSVIGLGVALRGWSENLYDQYQTGVTIISIVASIAALLLVFRYLDRIPQEPAFHAPPPPPTFNKIDSEEAGSQKFNNPL